MLVRFEIDHPRWLEFVSANEAATVFHHPAWAGLLADTYRYSAFALALEGEGGRIVAGLPVVDVSNRLTGKRWVSLPYTDACRPLVAPGGAVDELVLRLAEEPRRQGVRELEVRAELPGASRGSPAVGHVHVLPLTADFEETERRFKPTVRQNVAQARRAGLTVRRAGAAEDVVDTFYRLQVRTRRRQGVPAQPRRYFAQLWQRILEPGLGFCLLAYREREPVAGAVFLAWKRTVLYKYAASDERHLNLRPNHLLVHEAIHWSSANGYSALDFGRTDRDNQGLRKFKSAWGAIEEPLVYSTLGDAARETATSSQRAALLGPMIRRSPPALCRALGELLYRYAA